MNLGRKIFNSKLNDLKKFENLDHNEKQFVFYSENQNSMFIFKSLIEELVNQNITVCYVTSSKDDPNLNSNNEKIKTFYIGEGIMRTKFFLNLKATILIMTMPDLGTSYIKRSKVYPVHYVYMFHAIASTHLVYKKNAFDNYDSIFCIGNFQIDEIRSRERTYKLNKKNLIKTGYSHLDNLIIKKLKNKQIPINNPIQVLIAPSWGDDGLFQTAIEKNITILLNSGFKVILRLHPMTQKKSEKKINFLRQKFSSNPNFILEKNILNFDSFMTSDIMITDWSGAAIEYAFTLERPVLFIDVPKKIHNPDYEKLPEIPIEISIRDKIGEIIPLSDMQGLPEKIQVLCQNQNIIKGKIQKIRGELIANLGNSSKLEVEFILKLKDQLRK
jgi:CDP-glycerol glycerophosphotransferase (TagB/SpsB family)